MKRGNKDVHNMQVSTEIHEWLNKLKLVKEEPFDNVLRRIKNKEVLL